MPLSNWAAGAFQKTVTNVFYSRGVSTRCRRTRRPAQQISLESLEPRQMLSVNPASSGSSASSSTDTSNIAAFVSQNTIGILSTVPSSPTSVVAVSGNTQLAVTWVAPASTGGSLITDYLVKYSSNNGSTWTNFVHPVSTALSCTVTGLTNGTAYVIKVIAKNTVGSSLPSANSASATPAATVPGSPTSVVAVSGNAQLAVTWAAPASTGGSNVTDYLVKYSSNSGSTWTNFVHSASTALSCTVTGLTNGTSYVIKVVAKNAVGISLPSANSAPATPAATVPSAPTSVVAVSGNTQLAVTWTAPASTGGSNITDYLVKYSSNGGVAGSWTNFRHPVSTAILCTVTGLTNGTAYVIKVIAKNAVGISLPSSNSAPFTPATPIFMSMVTVGNLGNAADTGSGYPGYGAVTYLYKIGKYDVTGNEYTVFLNAVGSTDTYGLYNTSMGGGDTSAQISRSGTSGFYTYAVMNSTGNRPISWVSWFDCARFSNWMSNGQPSGAQVSTTTENGVYNVNGATSGNAVTVNATNPNTGLAPTYRIPLENEWYKAAYYSPNYGGYYVYATQSDTAPGTTIGSSPNQANYSRYAATDVGSFTGSGSFYGTFDQSGNMNQWNDLNGTTGGSRGLRGGGWNNFTSISVSSSNRVSTDPSNDGSSIGFRLASPV